MTTSADSPVRHGVIATEYGATRATVLKVLAKAKLKPIVNIPGKGGMVLFEGGPARAAMDRYVAKRKPKAEPTPAPAPAPVTPPTADLAPLSRQLDEAQAAIEALQKQVQTVHAQHAVLLKAIEKVGVDLAARLGGVEQAINLQLLQAVTEPVALPPAAPEPDRTPPVLQPLQTTLIRTPRLVIIGALPNQAQLIGQEFGNMLDLRFITTDDAKGKRLRDLVGSAQAAITLTGFISHGVEDALKAANVRLIRVSGGMTSLRDKLRDLVTEFTPPARAA